MTEALKERYYTYEEWLSWDEDVRAELVDGVLYMMALPVQRHQKILGELYGQLWQYLKGKPCRVFPAPFGVRLDATKETALEPDIVIVCDKTKLEGNICLGAPDMIIEILSPSSIKMDNVIKHRLYQKAEVREYWIVDPEHDLLQAGVLHEGKYTTSMFDKNDKAPVSILEGCEIDLSEVFNEEWIVSL